MSLRKGCTPRSGVIMIFDVTVADSDSKAASGVTGLYVAQMITNVDHLSGDYVSCSAASKIASGSGLARFTSQGVTRVPAGGVNGIADIKGSANRRNLFVTTPQDPPAHQ